VDKLGIGGDNIGAYRLAGADKQTGAIRRPFVYIGEDA
jgi:hypothetical protein